MKKLIYLFALTFFISNYSQAAVRQTTGGGGDWSSAATWVGGNIPTGSDNVVVNAGDSLIVTDTRSCTAMIIAYGNNASYLRIASTGQLTVTGSTSVEEGPFPNFDPRDFSLLVQSGGILSMNSLAFTASRSDVVFDVTVNGTMTVTGAFQFAHNTTGDNCASTVTVGSSGRLTCGSFAYRSLSNIQNTLDLTNNGFFRSNGAFTSEVSEDCIVTVDINNFAYFNTLTSRTANDNSQFTVNVVDSLVVFNAVQMIASTTASLDENQINVDFAGAYFRFGFFQAGFNGRLNATANNASIVEQNSSGGGITLLTSSRVRYHHLILNVSGSFGIKFRGDTLDKNHLFGDLTVRSGCIFTLEHGSTPKPLGVTGNLINNGTIIDKGAGISVGGDFNNNFVIDNNGSSIVVDGNIVNSGTFSNVSTSDKISSGGDFTNNGTFQANVDSLVVGGDFINNATYVSLGNDIYLSGNWNNAANYFVFDDDLISFEGSSAQTIDGNTTFSNMNIDNSSGVSISSGTINLEGLMTVPNGTFTTNNSLIFISDINHTASIGDLTGGGSVSGNVTVQRFLNEGAGWYMLGSPVTGATLADWNNEMPMSGFTGSDEPANPWVSVYSYDETTRAPSNLKDSGYVEASNITQSLVPGEGWFVYFDQVKAGATAGTMDVTGPLQTGTVNMSLSFTPGLPDANLNGGWHMRSNPYASPVDWALVTKSNIENGTAYVMGSDGNYLDVFNDLVDFIYSGEAFWVHSPGISGSLTFEESDKAVITDDYNAKQAPSPFTLPLKMELSMASNATYVDYSVIRFHADTGYSANFDLKEGDSRKLDNAAGVYPNISTYPNNVDRDVYYNTMSASIDNFEMPVRIWKRYPAYKTETFTITFEGIDEWDMNNKCLVLWDSVANVTQKISKYDNTYTFTAFDTLSAPRIFLSYSTPLELSYQDASCFGMNDGTATANGDASGNHTYTWMDSKGNEVKKDKDISGPSTATGLAPGEYVVWVSRNGDCGTVAATIVISEPDPILADFSSDKDTVFMNANTTIAFTNSSVNAAAYFWDFGDGNTSTEENPSHTFTKGGTFEVMMFAQDGICEDTSYKTIEVINNVGIANIDDLNESIKIYQQNFETFVEFNLTEGSDAIITMHDVIGRSVIEPMKILNAKNQKIKVNIPQSILGIYTISVITDNDKLSKKLYFTER